jgi:hypothetical protein
MDDSIKKIILAATRAPSGDNCQPWRFVVNDSTIFLYNVPERDESFYNVGQRGSHVAHGAAIENIDIAASSLGYRTDIKIFSDNSEQNLIAEIKLEQNTTKEETLYPYIEKRVTNRKPYLDTPLNNVQIDELSKSKREITEVFFTTISDRIVRLAEIGSTNEKIMLGNKAIHSFFFNHINWSEKEELRKRYGFYLKTLELPPPAQIMFKVLRSWWRARLLNKLMNISNVVAQENTKVYAAAGGMGIITIPNNDPESFIEAGRTMQRLWLTATKMGLSIQPLTGVLFFMQKIILDGGVGFSEAEKKLIHEKYAIIKNIFSVPESHTIAMMFRIGVGDMPSAQSSRYELNKFIATE